jgi:osmotically-inducible protein OsmY
MADRYDERYRDDWRRDRDRGFIERAGDEVKSWFGDEEAERRRRLDEARYGRSYGRDYPQREYGRDWDRGPAPRSADEVRSWFGDDEAERRRRMDEARYGRDPERYGRDWDRYGRDWDYGHMMGFDYGRSPREWRERDRSGTETARVDYWRPGWPGQWNEQYRERGYGYSGRQSFVGRGPRGYQRSDDRIREDVCERLTENPWVDASDIEIAVRAGEVTLSGTVRDRTDKREAEDVAEHVSGVREVHNNLRVASGFEGTPREPTASTGSQVAGTAGSRR